MRVFIRLAAAFFLSIPIFMLSPLVAAEAREEVAIDAAPGHVTVTNPISNSIAVVVVIDGQAERALAPSESAEFEVAPGTVIVTVSYGVDDVSSYAVEVPAAAESAESEPDTASAGEGDADSSDDSPTERQSGSASDSEESPGDDSADDAAQEHSTESSEGAASGYAAPHTGLGEVDRGVNTLTVLGLCGLSLAVVLSSDVSRRWALNSSR